MSSYLRSLRNTSTNGNGTGGHGANGANGGATNSNNTNPTTNTIGNSSSRTNNNASLSSSSSSLSSSSSSHGKFASLRSLSSSSSSSSLFGNGRSPHSSIMKANLPNQQQQQRSSSSLLFGGGGGLNRAGNHHQGQGGQTQLQVQRQHQSEVVTAVVAENAQQQQQKQQQATSLSVVHHQQHQQQQQQQGVISMEEVLADLRILESQQQESVQKLQQAKMMKQRRLEQQTTLEEKLDQYKYENGQLSVEIQRTQELLSYGQQELNIARKASITAGNDLREYDTKVNRALDIKTSILLHQGTQDVWMMELRNKVGSLDHVLSKLEEEKEQAQKEYDIAVQLDDQLRSDIKNQLLEQQRIVDQTKKLETDTTVYEMEYETMCEEEVVIQQKMAALDQDVMELDKYYAECLDKYKALQANHTIREEECETEHDALKASLKQTTDDLHRVWRETVDIQKMEGHDVDALPSESDALPVLDINRIRHSVQVELDAVASESKMKEEMDEFVQVLSNQFQELQVRYDSSTTRLSDLRSDNIKNAQIEHDRETSINTFMMKYEQVRNDLEMKESLVQSVLADREVEIQDYNQMLISMNNELDELKAACKMHMEKSFQLDDEIVEVETKRHQVMESDQQQLVNVQKEVQDTKSNIISLQNEIRTIESSTAIALATNNTNEQNEEHGKEIDRFNRKIEALLKEFPELEQLPFNYRPDLSHHEQALIDLNKLFQKCRKQDQVLDNKINELEKVLQEKKDTMKSIDSKSKTSKEIRNTYKEAGKNPILPLIAPVDDKSIHESTTKPRSLLSSFIRKTTPDTTDMECTNKMPSDRSVGKVATGKMDVMDGVAYYSEKKVHWEVDQAKNNNLLDDDQEDDIDEHQLTQTTFSSLQKKAKGGSRRSSFGSADTSKTFTATSTLSKVKDKKYNSSKTKEDEKHTGASALSKVNDKKYNSNKTKDDEKHVTSSQVDKKTTSSSSMKSSVLLQTVNEIEKNPTKLSTKLSSNFKEYDEAMFSSSKKEQQQKKRSVPSSGNIYEAPTTKQHRSLSSERVTNGKENTAPPTAKQRASMSTLQDVSTKTATMSASKVSGTKASIPSLKEATKRSTSASRQSSGISSQERRRSSTPKEAPGVSSSGQHRHHSRRRKRTHSGASVASNKSSSRHGNDDFHDDYSFDFGH